MPTPRVFIIRHGETEWSLSGQHTGVSDIPLTAAGERRMRSTGASLLGANRLIQPRNLSAVLVSPRRRARRTLGLLLGEGTRDVSAERAVKSEGQVEREDEDVVVGHDGAQAVKDLRANGVVVELRDDVREWDYGDYEGLTTAQIKKGRADRGEGGWSIWSDGCPGGESPQQVSDRLDALIADIRTRFHRPAFEHMKQHGGGAGDKACPPTDVMVVAHGHILRCFACRWLGRSITTNPNYILEAGGVGTLSYEHNNIDEPALVLGGAFVMEE